MQKNNKKWVNYLVGILIVGLIGAYVPFLFSAPQIPVNYGEEALQKEVVSSTSSNPTQTQTKVKEEDVKPEGFSGIEEEQELLDELNNL